MNKQPIKNCLFCKLPIPEGKHRYKYCNDRCSADFQNAKVRQHNSVSNLSRSTTGALHELVASIDLMRQGYEVFRALSPATSCDLIILKAHKLLRVEVRTAQKPINSNKLQWHYSEKDVGRSDVLALVVDSKTVIYLPALDDL